MNHDNIKIVWCIQHVNEDLFMDIQRIIHHQHGSLHHSRQDYQVVNESYPLHLQAVGSEAKQSLYFLLRYYFPMV